VGPASSGGELEKERLRWCAAAAGVGSVKAVRERSGERSGRGGEREYDEADAGGVEAGRAMGCEAEAAGVGMGCEADMVCPFCRRERELRKERGAVWP
jgi:hypothetical protein